MTRLNVSDWPEVPLCECADISSGGTPPKSEPSYWGGDIPWVSAKDMRTFRVHDAQDHVTAAGVAHGTRVAPTGATLILVRGMTLHDHVPICWLLRDSAFNQDVKAVTPKSGVHPEYLAYWLAASERRLHGLVDAAGHGTGRIGGPALASLPVRLPPLAEQRRIAAAFGSLDRKIELNRRMNRTLESIARAIFKSWFIDFDPVRKKMEGKTGGELGLPPSLAALFPDQLDPSTDAPEGWPVTSLGQLVTASRRTVTPAEMADQVVDHYSIPAFDDGRMPTVAEGSAIKSNKFLVEDGIVLVSRLNPRIPRVWFPRPRGRRCVCSTEYLVLSPEPQVTPEFIYGLLCSESFGDELVSRVTGTSGSHQRVKPGDALSIQVVLPPPPAIEQFSEVTAPLLRRAGHCLDESERLASVRDALLPRLLGGSFRGHDGRVSRGEVAP